MRNSETNAIPILTYHSIDRSGSVISITPQTFRRQMTLLSESGCRVVSLGKLIEIFNSKKPFPEKTIALTFDDGFQNFFIEAFPVLTQYHFKATVFLVTDFCGKSNDWAGNPPDLPRSKLLAWSEIRELKKSGIEFGAHTRTHPDLTRVSEPEAASEMTESKAIIEDKLGCETTTFAYPYGKLNSQIRQIAENNFNAACSTNLGKARPNSDFFALERIDSYYLSRPLIFNFLTTKTVEQYLRVRQVLRHAKARISSN